MENGMSSKELTGEQNIEVTDSDVDGISIIVTRGATIQGRVVWDGKPSQDSGQFWVSAFSTEESFQSHTQALVQPNLQFVLENV
jgi:hypothetical protein